MALNLYKIFAPRAIRNNNPGNIIYSVSEWQGLTGKDFKGFCIFDTPENGMRAALLLLLNYWRFHNCRNVTAIISRWCPPSGGDTKEYIRFVADYIDRTAVEELKKEDLPAIFKAISVIESGREYLKMADIQKVWSKL